MRYIRAADNSFKLSWWNVGRHATAIPDEPLAVSWAVGRQHQRLFERTIEIVGEVYRVLFEVSQHFFGHFMKAGFGITHGRRGVAIHRAEIALPSTSR